MLTTTIGAAVAAQKKSFRDVLVDLRIKRKLSIKDLAQKTRIPSSDILTWESGHGMPTRSQFSRLKMAIHQLKIFESSFQFAEEPETVVTPPSEIPKSVPRSVPQTFGEVLKSCREGEGLSQEDLSTLLCVYPGVVDSWERDKSFPGAVSVLNLFDIFPEMRKVQLPIAVQKRTEEILEERQVAAQKAEAKKKAAQDKTLATGKSKELKEALEKATAPVAVPPVPKEKPVKAPRKRKVVAPAEPTKSVSRVLLRLAVRARDEVHPDFLAAYKLVCAVEDSIRTSKASPKIQAFFNEAGESGFSMLEAFDLLFGD